MFKSLSNLISKKPEPPLPPTRPVSPFSPAADRIPAPAEEGGEHAPIYQSLAMTQEMREALFPTTPRMVSAIFERSTALAESPAPSAADDVRKQLEQLQQQIQQIQKGAGGNGSFPLV